MYARIMFCLVVFFSPVFFLALDGLIPRWAVAARTHRLEKLETGAECLFVVTSIERRQLET